jgi:hypothetical protein
MRDNDLRRAKEIERELRAVFRALTGPPGKATLRKVSALCAEARTAVDDEYCRTKVATILDYARTLSSANAPDQALLLRIEETLDSLGKQLLILQTRRVTERQRN